MWQKYLSLLSAVLVLLCLRNGNAQTPTFEVHLGNLLQMQQGFGWPLHLHVVEGHQALMRLSRTLENQESCVVTTPAGVTFDVRNPPSNRYENWSDGCGVRVRNVVPTDHGRWRMTATSGDHSITGWSEVDVEESISQYTPGAISLHDGQTHTLVELTTLNNSYCMVTQPFSESSLVPGRCHVTLDRTTRAVQGRWSVLLGLPGRVTELAVERNVAVEAERLDVGYVRDIESNKLHLYCNILHTAKNITFCRFQKSTDSIGYNVMEGLSDGRHSYYGKGFFERECGMTIEFASSEDYGTWRCTVGVHEWAGTTIEQRTPMQALISVSPNPGTRIRREDTKSDVEVRTLFVEKDSSLTIMCRADMSLAYCWFQHPNGSQFTPVERQAEGEQDFWYTGESLQTGDCGITFSHISEDDAGAWTCHMGPMYQLGVEIMDDVLVRVTGPLAANQQEVNATIGGVATLYCHTANGPRPLDYCRFLSPNSVGMRLDSSVNVENAILNRFYFTPERDLDYGDCSLTIDPVLEEDIGQWTCAGLLHDQTTEARDIINLNYVVGRRRNLRAGLAGMGGGLVVLAVILVGALWYKKGRPIPWRRERTNPRSDTFSLGERTDRSSPRSSTSTTSSDERVQA